MDATIASGRIGEPERRRALFVLLLSTFFAWGGFFMVIPLVSVHYVDGLGWTAASIGIILAIRQFTQQGLAVGGGIMADRFGTRGPIIFGMGLRAIGFVAMGFATSWGMLLASVVLSSLGGALFESPRAAAIAALTDPSERPRFYSLVGVAGGLGTAAGTQLGALLIRTDFTLVSVVAGGSYLIILTLLWLFLPPVRVAADDAGLLTGLGLALHDAPFTRYTVLMMGHWFLSSQFYIALPLLTVAVTGSAEGLVLVYGVNSAVSVLLAYPLPRLAARVLAPPVALILGNTITALGLLIMGLSVIWGPPVLLAGVFVFSAGLITVRPNDQTVQAALANPVALGSYFGIAALSLGIGGGVGNMASGWLYDLGQSLHQPLLPWAVCAVVGLLTSTGLWWTMVMRDRARHPVREPEMRGF